jgi:hypothetical protein
VEDEALILRLVRVIAKAVGYAISVLVVAGGVWLLVLFFIPVPDWTLPPLLRNLPATRGYVSACPLPPDLARLGMIPADASEFNARLARMFPTGLPEARMVETLSTLKFEILHACEFDSSIRTARFDQHGFGPYMFPLWAGVYWKVDLDGNIEWTKGFIAYTGP